MARHSVAKSEKVKASQPRLPQVVTRPRDSSMCLGNKTLSSLGVSFAMDHHFGPERFVLSEYSRREGKGRWCDPK